MTNIAIFCCVCDFCNSIVLIMVLQLPDDIWQCLVMYCEKCVHKDMHFGTMFYFGTEAEFSTPEKQAGMCRLRRI